MTTCAPPRSIEQRLAALARANRIRGYRRILKHTWRAAGQHHAAAMFTLVLGAPPPELQSMRVRDLLLTIPKIGAFAADRALHRADVDYLATVTDLTVQQRCALAAWADALQTGPYVCPTCNGTKGYSARQCRSCYIDNRGRR